MSRETYGIVLDVDFQSGQAPKLGACLEYLHEWFEGAPSDVMVCVYTATKNGRGSNLRHVGRPETLDAHRLILVAQEQSDHRVDLPSLLGELVVSQIRYRRRVSNIFLLTDLRIHRPNSKVPKLDGAFLSVCVLAEARGSVCYTALARNPTMRQELQTVEKLCTAAQGYRSWWQSGYDAFGPLVMKRPDPIFAPTLAPVQPSTLLPERSGRDATPEQLPQQAPAPPQQQSHVVNPASPDTFDALMSILLPAEVDVTQDVVEVQHHVGARARQNIHFVLRAYSELHDVVASLDSDRSVLHITGKKTDIDGFLKRLSFLDTF